MKDMKVYNISPWFSPVAVLQYLPGHPRHPPALLPLVSTQLTVSVLSSSVFCFCSPVSCPLLLSGRCLHAACGGCGGWLVEAGSRNNLEQETQIIYCSYLFLCLSFINTRSDISNVVQIESNRDDALIVLQIYDGFIHGMVPAESAVCSVSSAGHHHLGSQ